MRDREYLLLSYLKEWKDLLNYMTFFTFYSNKCFVHMHFKRKSVLLIRYLLLPHPPDSGGGEEGAGGGLQQEGGGDAGDRDGGARWAPS